jgi:hypothetical protein
MSNARNMVKNLTNVGWIGKARKEVHLVSDFANDGYHHHLFNVHIFYYKRFREF